MLADGSNPPKKAPLLVFSDDWGRHPSSCQHLVARLLRHRQVIWVNTIGSRPPDFSWSTLTRGMEKLRQWFLTRRPVSPDDKEEQTLSPLVLNPKMWPSFRSRFARAVNRRLLLRSVSPAAAALAEPPIAITTLPLTADLVGLLPAARWVYYCVDDFSVWPGLDGRTLQSMEAELVAKVDVAVAASETLQTHLARLGRPAQLLTHGVDLEFWRAAPKPSRNPDWWEDIQSLPGPLMIFWGVIDRRLDVSFVQKLAETLEKGTILFVGPRDNPDPALFAIPRVQFRPALPFDELPLLAARTEVFLAPYADLPVTRAMQPLKLKEYLATGKPVVVRKLPATEPWADCADVVGTAAEFAAAVTARLASGVPAEQREARRRLEAESWDAKAAQFEQWIDAARQPPFQLDRPE
jgi:glycosyltransferase involved in cell wall biosynthesis